MLCFTLAVTACSSSNYNSDEVPDISPENLYNVAKSGMATGDFALARRYLEAIDSRYPFGSLTSQVQLDLIYVYYKERESDLALAQINRFIRLSPTHPNIDYVYYMKGLTEIQKRSDMIQDYLGLDRSEKDPSFYQAAFNTFRDLIRSYPNSIYAADARQRMIYIKEELAKCIYLYFDEINQEPVVYHWTYKLDEISVTEAVEAGVKSNDICVS